jgi:hypothetical protein
VKEDIILIRELRAQKNQKKQKTVETLDAAAEE